MRRLVLLLLTTLLALFSGWTARAENLDFSEIYSGYSAEGLTFSDKTQSLAGGEVTRIHGAAFDADHPVLRSDGSPHVRLPVLLERCGLAGQYHRGQGRRPCDGAAL